MAPFTKKKNPKITETSVSGSSSSSSVDSDESKPQVTYSPRKARFARATTVHSPAGLGPTARKLDMIPAAFNSYHPQTQTNDIGFGYLPEFEQNARVDMPVTPFSSMRNKFANTPGAHSKMTLGGESVLSPTIREEMALEKTEKNTEKQQAKDLVRGHDKHVTCFNLGFDPLYPTNTTTESQNPRPHGQTPPPIHKPDLLPNRPLPPQHNLLHLQRHQSPSSAQLLATLGRPHRNLAASHPPRHRLHLTLHLFGHNLPQLARQE